MSLADEMRADFRSVHSDLPSFVDIGGAHVAALISQGSLAETLDPGGFYNQHSLTVKLLRDELAELPRVGEIVHYNSIAYRINSISAKASVPIVVLECLQK